eukprot:9963464-Ditylum_brightwellii.AAC.1
MMIGANIPYSKSSTCGALCTWGEAGMVKVKTKTMPKLSNKGITCMFVGHALNHADGTYRIDVTWLRRTFYEKKVEDNKISVRITTEARESDVSKASGDEFPSPDDNNDDGKMPGL